MIRRARALVALVALAMCGAGCDRAEPRDDERVVAVFGETGLGFGQFSYPRGLTVSPVDGCIFVVDKTARIQRFSPEGKYESGWRMPEWENGKPTGIKCDASGRLWVADTHYHRVIVYDREGVEQFRFGRRGEGKGEFIFPTCVAWDASGAIYVGEYGGNDRISKFTGGSAPQYEMSFGTRDAGAASLERPTAIEVDAQGTLWVADGCHHRVCRFSAAGKFLGAIGTAGHGPGELDYAYDLALERGEPLRMVVTDHGNNRVQELDAAGHALRTWGTVGRARGQVTQPWKAQFDRAGRLLVLDSWNNRVQVLKW
ncbi:MAG: hypothetical protein U1A27_10835 [Phycisphaerae bacterium]